ncbi:sarcosine oxidase subunit gamma [Rhizobium tumorigenes]|uniref:Sarcosine oxidase subunit gamma family protein n=1 Tax=Rhizobium tumorigenes TaxID=2041385 RepID=A0AAF1KRR6_9HYPH|nr:sarcosine oxidase subunit gamma family protein [Rhizobium tumorigenes]WFR94376.1 sarcosine oxidase subunit gamma family protein [Rhizobium tumorigenes]WFR99852.1 sarcosine oxidase subunit gamma family protein [Rhizobium tumorigenes]
MSVAFTNRHILEDRIAGFHSQPSADHLSIIRHAAIFSVLAHTGHEAWALAALRAMQDVSVRSVGPGEWLVISEALGAESLARDLSMLDAARLSFFEQSDGRTLLRLSGPNVRAILAKCVPVDLHRDVFADGQSGAMLCCHVSANLARTGADTFEIAVMRSFAGTVFDEVLEMGREFNLTAGFAD